MNTIDVERRGRVAVFTINRPEKLNAISRPMARQMQGAVETCNADDDVRCVVLTGAGARAFCAGTDITQLDEFDDIWSFRNREDYCGAVRKLRKPIVCAINGYALGGGLEMALSCDIRIASANARLGAPEIKLGWIGGGGMSVMLSRSAGWSNAGYMLMTGDPIEAEKALEWHLVSEVTNPDLLMTRALEIAETIASRAPIAAETAKLNLQAAAEMPERAAIQYELDLQTVCFATEDAKEGRRAFAEKREAKFSRR